MSDIEHSDIEQAEVFDDIRNPDVVTKYKEAAVIANGALEKVIAECKQGARVTDLCALGDAFIVESTDKLYRKGGKAKITKGIGFPTCVSVNNIVGSNSPMNDDTTELKDGDVVKIDCGVHLDGYLSQVAHTVVVGEGAIEGRKADVLAAVYTAADCAVRLLKAGAKNTEITKVLDLVAADFNVKCVEGIMSHNTKKFEIDGEKKIINGTPETPLTGDNKVAEEEFTPNDVWALDIVMSTGTGKSHQSDKKTTVFKRQVEKSYKLKMKASRAFFSEVMEKHPIFPFSVRNLSVTETQIKLGVKEATEHQLLEPYVVLKEKEGEIVAHVKFTVLLMASGSLKVTGLPYDISQFKTEHSVKNEEIKKVLALPLPKNKKKKNKKKKNKN